MERMLGAELTAHLGYEAGSEPPSEQTNRRNGVGTKRVKGSDGEVPLAVKGVRRDGFAESLEAALQRGDAGIVILNEIHRREVIVKGARLMPLGAGPGSVRGAFAATGVRFPAGPAVHGA